MLAFFGIGAGQAALTQEEENSLTTLAQMEYKDQKQMQLYSDLAKGFLEALTIKEAVQIVGLILQKRFEIKNDVFDIFPQSFVFLLTRQLLQKLKYPVGENGQTLLKLLHELIFKSGLSSNNKSRKQSLEHNKSFQKLIQELKNSPVEIIALLVPLFHALITVPLNPEQEEGLRKTNQAAFLEVFSKLFLFDALVNVEVDNINDETKLALGQNAYWLNLFPDLMDKLNTASTSYRLSKPSDNAFIVASTYQKLFSLHSFLATLMKIFGEIKYKFVKPTTEWPAIYDKINGYLQGFHKSLMEETINKDHGQIRRICRDVENNLNAVLAKITHTLPRDFSCVEMLMRAMEPMLKRSTNLTAILGVIEKTGEKDSPVQQFYGNGIDKLNQHLENIVVALIYNMGALNEGSLTEQIKQYNQEVDAILQPFKDDRLEDQTALHRLVKQNFSSTEDNAAQTQILRKKLQEQIECLIVEGFDPKAMTTNYPRSGGWAATLRRRPNEPIDVAALAALYGNSDIFEAALQGAQEKRALLQDILTQTQSEEETTSLTSSRTVSAAFAALDAAVVSLSDSSPALYAVLAAKAEEAAQAGNNAQNTDAAMTESNSPILGWHREGKGVKRQMRAPGATPGTTPSASPSTTPLSTPRASREAPLAATDENPRKVEQLEQPIRATVKRIVRKPSFGASGPNTDVF